VDGSHIKLSITFLLHQGQHSTAQTKATQSGKQYRIVDEDGNLMDLFYP